jgi:hypothetical protein
LGGGGGWGATPPFQNRLEKDIVGFTYMQTRKFL